jgi:hypothetical protein
MCRQSPRQVRPESLSWQQTLGTYHAKPRDVSRRVAGWPACRWQPARRQRHHCIIAMSMTVERAALSWPFAFLTCGFHVCCTHVRQNRCQLGDHAGTSVPCSPHLLRAELELDDVVIVTVAKAACNRVTKLCCERFPLPQQLAHVKRVHQAHGPGGPQLQIIVAHIGPSTSDLGANKQPAESLACSREGESVPQNLSQEVGLLHSDRRSAAVSRRSGGQHKVLG